MLIDDLDHDRTILKGVFFQDLILDMVPFKRLFIVCGFLLNKLQSIVASYVVRGKVILQPQGKEFFT